MSKYTYSQDCPYCYEHVLDLEKHLHDYTCEVILSNSVQCKTGKKGYKTVSLAKEAIENIWNFAGVEFRKYKCKSCGNYHLTDVHYG